MPAAVPTILIARPQPFAAELAAAMRAEGWNPVVLDILATKAAADPGQLAQRLNALLPVSQAIFTSRSAVNYTFQILDPADFRGTNIAAVGPGSAQELKAYGFSNMLLPNAGANSEFLLQCGEFSAEDAGTAIIFCAPHGRDLLQRELGERGWQVHVAEVYERILQAPTGQTLAEIRAANQLVTVCTSATAITACCERLPADIWQQMTHQPWLVISERLEAIARDAGAREIYQSAAPGNAAISEAIRNIVNT